MGNLRASSVVACLGLAACGSDHAQVDAGITFQDASPDAKVFLDAPPPTYDFSCTSNPAPAAGSAAANITISGTVQEVSLNGLTPSIMPADGATLNACVAGAPNCSGGNRLAGPVTSAGGGNYSLGPIATGTDPVDGYITLAKTGDKDAYIFPPQALIADQGMVPTLTFTTAAFNGIVTFLQINQSAANGTLALVVTDCANQRITENVTLSVKQGGSDVTGTTPLDLGQFDAMAGGVHIIFNVPPGDTEVGATYMGMALRAHVVKTVADSMTETIVRPGYF
jgi:hypothetical protein